MPAKTLTVLATVGVLQYAASAAPPEGAAPAISGYLDAVSPTRLQSDVEALAAFRTRHSLSDPDPSGTGIGAARQWILERFQAAGGRLQPAFDPHTIPPGRRVPREVEMVNVLAVLPGTMPEAADRYYYVIGHYDSRASDPMDPDSAAPGANDDGSGTVLVLELARVLADAKLDSTVVFMATAGEEQGLLGARAHAKAAAEAGRNILGVLSNDIVGDPTGANGREDRWAIRVFSEGIELNLVQTPGQDDDQRALAGRIRALGQVRGLGAESDSPSRGLARFIAEVGAREGTAVRPKLIFRPDRFLRGGDHTAFNEFGFPAVRFTEVHENYDRQHQDVRTEDGKPFGDLAEHVDAEYLADVAKLNLAALVHLANAPSPPRVRVIAGELAYDTTLRWDASPEPDVAGYEVVYRETTSALWQQVVDVGMKTEATLDLSKDDWFFGVRAYDKDGYRSPVALPLPAAR